MCMLVSPMDTIRKNRGGGAFMKTYHQLVKHKGNHDLFKGIEMSMAALANTMPLHIHAERAAC